MPRWSTPHVVAIFLESADSSDYADATTFRAVLVLEDGELVDSGLTLE